MTHSRKNDTSVATRNTAATTALGILMISLITGNLVAREPPRQVAVVSIQNLSGTEIPDPLEQIFRTALMELFQPLGFLIRVADEEGETGGGFAGAEADTDSALTGHPIAGHPGAFLLAAEEMDAAVALSGFVRVTDETVLFQLKLYDVEQRTVLATIAEERRPGLSLYNAVRSTIAGLAPVLETFLNDRSVYFAPTNRVETIVIRSPDEGATVSIAGSAVGTITEGTLSVPFTPFPLGTAIDIRTEKPGYHTRSTTHTLDRRDNEIILDPLIPFTENALSPLMEVAPFIGIGVGYKKYLVPDTTFGYARAALLTDLTRRRTVRGDISLVVGRYLLLPVHSPLRLHLTVGGGYMRTAQIDGTTSWFGDWYISLGNPTVEANIGALRLFATTEIRYALGTAGGDQARGWQLAPGFMPPLSVGVVIPW